MPKSILTSLLMASLIFVPFESLLARGRGVGGEGGGGMARPAGGGGGGAMSRPAPGGAGQAMARPAGGGGERPGAGNAIGGQPGGGRPTPGGGNAGPANSGGRFPGGAPENRPNVGAATGNPFGASGIGQGNTRPAPGGNGAGPAIGTTRPAPGDTNRPNLGGANNGNIGNRPNPGNTVNPNDRPGLGNTNRPNPGNGVGAGIGNGNNNPVNRPGIADGNRPNPGTGIGNGIGNTNINAGNRPNIGNNSGNTVNINNNRPGLNDVNRPGVGNGIGNTNINAGNRPSIGNNSGNTVNVNNRPNSGNNNVGNAVNHVNAGNNFGTTNNININSNHNNYAVANGNNWNNAWHHGYWGGSGYAPGYAAGYHAGAWNSYANRPWYTGAAAVGVGMSAWALGSIAFSSGYASYSNPFPVSTPSYYNYSQPIQVVTQPAQVVIVQDGSQGGVAADPNAAPAVQPTLNPATVSHVDNAQSAFKSGDYATAGSELELAIKEQPNDSALHEFRALVYFATGDYSKAAGTLYAVLSAGPGWDWTTMSSLYPSVDTYTQQLRALEKQVSETPGSADARFVLAYHYMTATYKDAALKQLQAVARLLPNDPLVTQLIKGFGGVVPGQENAPPAVDPPQVAGDPSQLPDLDPAKIVGRRTASRPDGTTFTLNLTADNKFTWGYDRAGKHEEFSGTYSIDGAVLVLERSDKSTMPGLVTMKDGGFNFTLFGAPDDDPGLDFKS